MGMVGVQFLQARHDHRVEPIQARQSGLVQGQIEPGLDLARAEGARGGEHHVIAAAADEQLGLQHVVSVIEVEDRANPGAFLELRQGVRRNVVVPVVKVHRLFGLDGGQHRQQARTDRRQGEAQGVEHFHDPRFAATPITR